MDCVRLCSASTVAWQKRSCYVVWQSSWLLYLISGKTIHTWQVRRNHVFRFIFFYWLFSNQANFPQLWKSKKNRLEQICHYSTCFFYFSFLAYFLKNFELFALFIVKAALLDLAVYYGFETNNLQPIWSHFLDFWSCQKKVFCWSISSLQKLATDFKHKFFKNHDFGNRTLDCANFLFEFDFVGLPNSTELNHDFGNRTLDCAIFLFEFDFVRLPNSTELNPVRLKFSSIGFDWLSTSRCAPWMGTPYNALYGQAPFESAGTFFRIQVFGICGRD